MLYIKGIFAFAMLVLFIYICSIPFFYVLGLCYSIYRHGLRFTIEIIPEFTIFFISETMPFVAKIFKPFKK